MTKKKTLGQLLKEARTKPCKHCKNSKGASLRQISAKCGVSNPYISQLEHDRVKEPSPKILEILAEVYGISYQDLMKAAGYRI